MIFNKTISLQDITHQQNHLYGYTDTCLTNIDEIYIMGDKKKKLIPGNTVPSKVKGIFIICKVSFLLYIEYIYKN
jgi:hypothetical protein